jgi:hypothetical protein
VLFSFVLDVAVLGHTPSLLSIGGSSLVAAGVLFVALSGVKRTGEERIGADGADRLLGQGVHEIAVAATLLGVDDGRCVAGDGGSGLDGELRGEATGEGLFCDPRVTNKLNEPLLSYGAEP